MSGFRRFIDMTGKRVGRLTVIKRAEDAVGVNKRSRLRWQCWCDCGNLKIISGPCLLRGQTKSCGCLAIESNRTKNLIHGRSKTPKYIMLGAARNRAKKRRIEFDITEDDIVIPDICPVFGIPITFSGGHDGKQNSPSLDRFDTTKGYTRDNIRVISWRANRIKSDATITELQSVIEYMTNAHS